MPPWRFSMLYDGLFSRSACLIYGSFDETRHKIPRIAIPPRRCLASMRTWARNANMSIRSRS
jgi:hypothetical protein